ncbi:MAG: AbrB/MazE/SpoVT family DNA-binding domain-containing protein [Deltaproteobacteria bacterium]|nr:AbrB/MazE/SpoVT family DNA-binding domain-containing protein [Deltaproteobacteria bacterium]
MKSAKLFRNGQSQAVRLPREMRFEGDHVFVKKAGRIVLLIPPTGSWDGLVESLSLFTTDFLRDRAQPHMQRRKGLTA